MYVPVAVNCCVVPAGIEALPGDTEIDTSVAGVTARTVLPTIELTVAEMLLVPTDNECAKPVVSIVATLGVSELQLAVLVRSLVEPSV